MSCGGVCLAGKRKLRTEAEEFLDSVESLPGLLCYARCLALCGDEGGEAATAAMRGCLCVVRCMHVAVEVR